jgi:hypothetical protein
VQEKLAAEKQIKSKKTEGVAQVVTYLPGKCKTLNSIPSTGRKEGREGWKELSKFSIE